MSYPTKKLGDVAKIEGGGTPSTKNPLFWNGDVSWLTPKELSDLSDREIFDTERKITSEGLRHSKLFPAGAVLFTSRAPIGYVAIAGIQMATNQGFKNFICNEKVLNNGFLYYFFKLKTKYLQSLGRGATFTEISRSILAKVEIPLPPLEIQKQIVERLDKVVGAQKLNGDLIQKTDELFQSLLHKELDPAGPAHIPIKQHTNKLEYVGMSGSRSKTPADASAFVKTSADKKAMAGKKNWEIKKLGDTDIIEIIDGDRGKNYPPKNEFQKMGFCLFLNTKNVTSSGFIFVEVDFIPKERDEKLRKGKLQRNDIVLTTRGTVGNSALYDDSVEFDNVRINSGMVILRPNTKKIIPKLLWVLMGDSMTQRQFKRILSGTAQPQLPITNLVKIKIPLPPLQTQRQIVAKLSAVQNYKTQLLAQKSKLKELFNSVLSKSFSG